MAWIHVICCGAILLALILLAVGARRWWLLPALLSTFAVGGAVAARAVVDTLLPWLFAASVGLLAYGHYATWVRRRGGDKARWILLVNTAAVAYLWAERVQLWLKGLL